MNRKEIENLLTISKMDDAGKYPLGGRSTHTRLLQAMLESDSAGDVSDVPGVLRRDRDAAIERAVKAEDARTQIFLDRNELITAAMAAIPEDEHPKDPTPHNWSWQIRQLGGDRRAVYDRLKDACVTIEYLRAELDKLKLEKK